MNGLLTIEVGATIADDDKEIVASFSCLQVGMMREEILETIGHNIPGNLVIVDKAERQVIYLRIVLLEKSLKFRCLHLLSFYLKSLSFG